MNQKSIWKTLIILSGIGIVLAFYLFYSYISPNPPDVCTINETVNCDAVTKGALSTIFGIPVSLVGLVGYIVILVSSYFKKKRLTLGMAAFGMVFCLRLSYLEIFVEKVLCPVCLACQIVMLLAFFLALKLNLPKSSLEESTKELTEKKKIKSSE